MTLRIVDVAGREITVLRRGQFAAGRHAESWNGRDRAGQAVAAGIYFAVLEAGGARGNDPLRRASMRRNP